MLKGDIKDLKELDRLLSETCDLVKDSSNKGSKAYTKIYTIKGNPIFKRVRLFFDERDKSGTIKITDYHPTYLGIVAFTLVHVGMLIQGSIQSIMEIL